MKAEPGSARRSARRKEGLGQSLRGKAAHASPFVLDGEDDFVGFGGVGRRQEDRIAGTLEGFAGVVEEVEDELLEPPRFAPDEGESGSEVDFQALGRPARADAEYADRGGEHLVEVERPHAA